MENHRLVADLENIREVTSQILEALESDTDSGAPRSKRFSFSGSGVGPQVYISSKFLGDTVAPGSGTTLGQLLFWSD